MSAIEVAVEDVIRGDLGDSAAAAGVEGVKVVIVDVIIVAGAANYSDDR